MKRQTIMLLVIFVAVVCALVIWHLNGTEPARDDTAANSKDKTPSVNKPPEEPEYVLEEIPNVFSDKPVPEGPDPFDKPFKLEMGRSTSFDDWYPFELVTLSDNISRIIIQKRNFDYNNRVRWATLEEFFRVIHEKIMDELNDKDFNVRLSGIDKFKANNLKIAVPAIILMLEDENARVRAAAAEALGEIDDRRAVPGLAKALKDKEKEVRIAAAKALGKIVDEGARQELAEALSDDDWQVQFWSALALCRICDPRAIPFMLKGLKDKNVLVSFRAANALKILNDKSVVPGLLELLEDPNEQVRKMAVRVLHSLADKRAVPALLRILKENDKEMLKQLVIDALGETRDIKAVPALLSMLKEKDASWRERVAKALGKIGDKSAVPALIKLLDDKELDVRYYVVRALGQIGDSSAVPYLAKALLDQRNNISYAASDALSRIGDKSVVPELMSAMQNKDRNVRWNAISTLGELGDKRATARLLLALKNKELRYYARDALCKIKDRRIVPELIKALKYEYYSNKIFAVQIMDDICNEEDVPALLPLLEFENKMVCKLAAYLLGEIGDKRAVPGLLKMFRDKNCYSRDDATEALAKIGERSIIPELYDLADNSKEAGERAVFAYALFKLGDNRGLEKLNEMLESKNSEEELAALCVFMMKLDRKYFKQISEHIGKFEELDVFLIRYKEAIPYIINNRLYCPSWEYSILEELTGQRLGPNVGKWRAWWNANKDRVLKEEAEKEKAEKAKQDKIKVLKGDDNREKSAEVVGKWGMPIEGLRCRLKINKKVFNYGERPKFSLELQNVSGKPINIAIEERGWFGDVGNGANKMGWYPPVGKFRKAHRIIKPNEIIACTEFVNTNEIYLWPGKHVFVGGYGYGDEMKVTDETFSTWTGKPIELWAKSISSESVDAEVLPVKNDQTYKGKKLNEWLEELKSEQIENRIYAIRTIGEMKNNLAVPTLINLLQDKSRNIYLEANDALKELTGKDFGQDQAQWLEWWEANKDRVLKEDAEKEKDANDSGEDR